LEINFGRYSEIVKRETGEPDWDTYEDYFEEVLEGRSIKSVVKALRNAGYSVSETTVRARFKEWLAYKRAREEFEIRLNQIKGELLSKIEEKESEILETLERELNYRSNKTKENFERLTKYVSQEIEQIKTNVNQEIENLKDEVRLLNKQVWILKKGLDQVITGIQKKGKLESLREAVERELTEDVINYLTS